MTNWKTSVSGILTVLLPVVAILVKYLNGEPITGADLVLLGGSGAAGTGLYHARDASTPETVMEKTTEIKAR